MFVRPSSCRARRNRRALERKALARSGVVVPGGAAEAEHRVFFTRLEFPPADECSVFVGLEVAHPDDHRLRVERRGNARDALAEPANEERAGVFRGRFWRAISLTACAILQVGIPHERHRVDADVVRHDELDARASPTPGVRNRSQIESPARIADDQHDLRARLGQQSAASTRSTAKGTRPA